MAMWITCRNYNHYLDKLSFIEKDGMKGNLPFSSAIYEIDGARVSAEEYNEVLKQYQSYKVYSYNNIKYADGEYASRMDGILEETKRILGF